MRIRINKHAMPPKDRYLFSETAARIRAFTAAHPDSNTAPENRILPLGIGDVTLPLPAAAVHAMEQAARELGEAATFRGYPPEGGYSFYREAVAAMYASDGVHIDPSEIFASDGAKSDLGNLPDILGENPILLTNPTYPAYLDCARLAGRQVFFLPAGEENGFLPTPRDIPAAVRDTPAVIYLCSPANPTGAAYSIDGLAEWVAYALSSGSLLLFDAAYRAFVRTPLPRSIYEIPGARACAAEIGSFSKSAGFTGVRAGWSILPEELTADGVSLRSLWIRRQSVRCNGLSWISQRGAAAVCTGEGAAACRALVHTYLENAALLAGVLRERSISFTGGVHAPYLWLRCPDGVSSWDFFTYLLEKARIAGTPGAGFGTRGEGYFRLSALANPTDIRCAVERLRTIL